MSLLTVPGRTVRVAVATGVGAGVAHRERDRRVGDDVGGHDRERVAVDARRATGTTAWLLEVTM